MTEVAAEERLAQGGRLGRGDRCRRRGWRHRGMGITQVAMMMAGHVERADSVLKTELKITDAQLPQWTTFADSLPKHARPLIEIRETRPTAQQATSMTEFDRGQSDDRDAGKWCDRQVRFTLS